MTTELEYVNIGQAARLFPHSASGKHPSPPTIWRWYQLGIRGIKLKTWKIGGGRYTTRQAIAEFIAATTAAAENVAPPEEPPPRPTHIAQQLHEAGVLSCPVHP